MPLVRKPGTFLAVLFDLEEVLLDRRRAWAYTVEEAVVSVCGRRITALELADEYRRRPWRHALNVVLDAPPLVDECEELCREIYGRSAMKRLLVHEGIGMALDSLRAASIEIGAVSHEPHAIARRQIESTGLDRFMTVLSASPAGERWDPEARIHDCLEFLGRGSERCAFVSGDRVDLERAARTGVTAVAAGWAGGETGSFPRIGAPSDISLLAG